MSILNINRINVQTVIFTLQINSFIYFDFICSVQCELCIKPVKSDKSTVDSTVQQEEKFEKLNDFLTVCGVSPVKCLLNRMNGSSERTQRRY